MLSNTLTPQVIVGGFPETTTGQSQLLAHHPLTSPSSIAPQPSHLFEPWMLEVAPLTHYLATEIL